MFRGSTLIWIGSVLTAIGASGCARSAGPELLTISAADYPRAFDAAIDAARDHGMPAVLRDRRSGVIETQPEAAGTLVEPWRIDNASFGQAVENTLGYQRRHARFEFSPAGMQPSNAPASQPETLTGPDVASGENQALDLTHETGELQLRVWVYLERANIPGFRRDTWSRQSDTTADLIVPEGEDGKPAALTWTPVARDPDYERRLLDAVQKSLKSEIVQK